MRTKPYLHCLPRGNTNTGPVKTGKNHFREILCGISITPQSDGEAKTSAVRPRKQPYNPRSGSSKADRQAPVAFSFRGLDIRHRLPDAKRSRELLRAPGGALCLSGFRHPRTVRTRPTSIIGHTQCLWQFAIHGRGFLPRCDCCAFSASHHSGLFLPQRDPMIHVR